MGISAVPGSGKTYTLSLLASQLIMRGELAEDQEILIVTLVNSAVDNFYHRISSFMTQSNLFPNLGYRVRTLHGLAHDIVRERPELVGLDTNFVIIDEQEAAYILQSAVRAWLQSNFNQLTDYFRDDLEQNKLSSILRKEFPELLEEIGLSFIRSAKDLQLTPQHLKARLEEIPMPLPLAQLGLAIYEDYQRALTYRGAVDFDDLVQYALQVLQSDPQLLERLRYRWPYILEDEAQDSSRLQEEILSLLAGPSGNWVRVGDPNQAIYETFTTANPKYLRNFINQENVRSEQLSASGRSTISIIHLANYFVEWTQTQHPVPSVRDALKAPPFIQPTPPDDPQPNPPDELSKIWLGERKMSPADEINFIVTSIARWLPDHPDSTVAVLAPRNQRAFELEKALREKGIPCIDDLLRSSSYTRASANALAELLRYLSDPKSASKLATVYRVYHRSKLENEDETRVEKGAELLRKCKNLENYIWPDPGKDWMEELDLARQAPQLFTDLSDFREIIRRWLKAVILPIDQIILTLAHDLFTEPAELALAHKLALLLRDASLFHPDWRMDEFTNELITIAKNERRFIGFSEDETGFDPNQHKGKVVIATIHKAKGLEWDRVYLMSVNNYDFPAGLSNDTYIAEKWYIRDHLNLPAETLEQLKAVVNPNEYHWYEEGKATLTARLDYIRERLRLLYVGITRAKKELIITWNTGRRGENSPAVALVALQEFWKDLVKE